MIFSVKIYVTCVAIFFKAYFLKLKKKKDVFEDKIEFWCEFTIALLIWENVDLCFGLKYRLTSRFGGEGSRFKRRINV